MEESTHSPKEESMPQIVNRGDVERQVGPFRLVKDHPQEITQELADELNRTPERLQELGLELILEPSSKAERDARLNKK
jgi:hypothetical protein